MSKENFNLDDLADACIDAEIPDGLYESLCISLQSRSGVTQAAANKAAEEGGLPIKTWEDRWQVMRMGKKHSYELPDQVECMAAEIKEHRDRASRQVANKAEVEQDKIDAERYRWLRNDPPLTLCVRRLANNGASEYLDGVVLDAAINVAMRLASPPATTGAMPKDLAIQLLNALTYAMTICDAVPSRAHDLADDNDLRGIGKLVNYQEDTGAYGYALIRDAEQALSKLIIEGGAVGASTVLTDERIAEIASANSDVPSFARAIERETLIGMLMANDSKIDPVAAQAGQVAAPEGWAQYKRELLGAAFDLTSKLTALPTLGVGQSQELISREAAMELTVQWRMRVDAANRKFAAAPSPAKESK